MQGVLAVLLPTEDLENGCLTALVGQILSEMILGDGIGGKASEPWLIWEAITKLGEVVQARMPKSKAKVRAERSNSNLADSKVLGMSETDTTIWRVRRSMEKTFWLFVQYLFFAMNAARLIIFSLATSPSLSPRLSSNVKITGSSYRTDSPTLTNATTPTSRPTQPGIQPILKMKIWSCVSLLLDLDVRMPWLSATFAMLRWFAITGPGAVGDVDGMADRLLSHAIHKHVLDPALLPSLLRSVRAALFPNNTLAPPRNIPSAADQLLIRRRCADTILSLIPAKAQDIYFGPGLERRLKEVEEVLDLFSDAYCNKHLMYGIVELVIIRLVPELAEKGVEELLEERLS